MKKKNLIAVGIVAVAVLIAGVAFVVTRNNGGDAEPVAVVDELPELETQEIETVESEPEVIEEVEEVKEEVKVEAESNGVSDEELTDEQESEESIVAVVEDEEEDEADEADKTDKVETTSTKTTETASTTNNTASNQNVDAATQAEVLEKAAANGFGFTNGTDGMTTVEVANDGAGVDMTDYPTATWE